MKRHEIRVGIGLALSVLGGASSCFIDSGSGDCVANGVEIDPCTIPMKVGQTRTFTASVGADPTEAVNWVRTAALDAGFDNAVSGNSIELIGTLGAAGVYKLRAESAADPSRFGETIISVSLNSYGYPPPPVQVNGTDAPEDYEGAVAAGGNRYYVAYADPPNPLAARAAADNFFVQQFDLAGNTLLATATDQFTLFAQRDPAGVQPNVAADCQGNGYWLDRPDANSPIEIRRLTAAGVQDSFALPGIDAAGPMAAACDGALYFFGLVGFSSDLYRIPKFGDPPVVFSIPDFPFAGSTFTSIATDAENRILLGDPCSSPAIIRVFANGGVDESFAVDASVFGVSAIAVDGQGVVYAVPADPGACGLVSRLPLSIMGFNSLGALLFQIGEYLYNCPGGCATTDCGTLVPFQSIQSIAAGPDGKLRVIDNVTLGAVPVECQVTLRLILLDT